jgi:hypothetical protein
MRTRTALALAVAAALPVLAFAAPAVASTQVTEHYIIDDGGSGYGIDSATAGADYHTATGNGGEFNAVIGDSWRGHQMYEWSNNDNGFCLTNQASTGQLYAAGCGDYPAAQAFYYTGSELENQQEATNANTACLFAVAGGSGANIVDAPFPSGQSCPVSYETNWATPVA